MFCTYFVTKFVLTSLLFVFSTMRLRFNISKQNPYFFSFYEFQSETWSGGWGREGGRRAGSLSDKWSLGGRSGNQAPGWIQVGREVPSKSQRIKSRHSWSLWIPCCVFHHICPLMIFVTRKFENGCGVSFQVWWNVCIGMQYVTLLQHFLFSLSTFCPECKSPENHCSTLLLNSRQIEIQQN